MTLNHDHPIMLFAGRSHPALARDIAESYGQPLGEVTIRNFSDGEIYVRFEQSIRGADLFIIQSTQPPADNIMELMLLIDAARRASAARITAVIPYFGYARQDRKDQPRVSIAAKLFADMLEAGGADRILTMDLHAPQIQGFFNIPVDHLYGSAVIIDDLQERLPEEPVVVAPDVGSLKLARAYAKRLKADLALIDKRRPQANVAEVMNVIGEVADRNVVLIDDMVDTAGTLCSAATALRERGALGIWAAATHPLLSGPAYERIAASPIDKLIITDTIPLTRTLDVIEVISVADHFADAIRRINSDESISSIFIP
jgi:ribose-phosphate pyrophosphokinase